MTQDARAFNWDSMTTKSTTGANPAAGAAPANLVLTLRESFKAMVVKVVNDANVANRTLAINLYAAANQLLYSAIFGTVTAGQTVYLILSAGNFTDDTTGTQQIVHIPAELVNDMPAGWYWNFGYTNIQVGDDFDAVVRWVKEAPA